MVVKKKVIKDLRDISIEIEWYARAYANDIIKEYEESWSHRGWSIGRYQITRLQEHVKQKVLAELVLSVDINYPELDRVIGMTTEELRKSRAEEKVRLRRKYGK